VPLRPVSSILLNLKKVYNRCVAAIFTVNNIIFVCFLMQELPASKVRGRSVPTARNIDLQPELLLNEWNIYITSNVLNCIH